MAYSFSFDASFKITSTTNLAGYLNHFAREENEIEMNHSNENIDPSRTHENITFVYDENAKHHLAQAKSHEQIMQALNDRWSDAIDLESNTYKSTGKKVRKDAVKAFGLIMQLDPQYFKDQKALIDKKYDPELYPEENKRAYRKVATQASSMMLAIAKKRFGEKNIVALSLHLDETNPHLHFIMTPITDDGRLNQKEFINAPKLKQMHGEFRKELREHGYDIDLERRTPTFAKRLSEKDYKELQRAKETLEKLEEEKSTLEAQKREFEANRALQMQNIQSQQQALHNARQELYSYAQELTAREYIVKESEKAKDWDILAMREYLMYHVPLKNGMNGYTRYLRLEASIKDSLQREQVNALLRKHGMSLDDEPKPKRDYGIEIG